MQTQKNPNILYREQNKMPGQALGSFSLSAEEKRSIMEALDHLHVIKQYQEMGACAVCKKITVKKCSGCVVFYCSCECQTFDFPKHRLHCSKQRDNMSDRNSFASSKKMRGSSLKNYNEEPFIVNDRGSPFTALANQLNKKGGNILSGSKSVTNFKMGNRQYQNRENAQKNNETGSNGSKENKKSNYSDRKKATSPKKLNNRKSPMEEKREIVINKNNYKEKQQNSSNEHLKIVDNIPNSTLGRKSLPKIGKMEVVGTYRESPNRYWVMDVKNLQKYEEVQRILNEEFATYESTYAKLGLVCACTFADEWFRAKVVSLTPETTVHFIDYGNSSGYDVKIFKKLPSDLESMPGLVFLIEFEEGTPPQYKTADLDSVKITIEETCRTPDGVARVKILEGNYGPTLKLQPVKKSSDKKRIKSPKEKSIIDTLNTKSNGMLFFVPGEGNVRYASLVPDNHKDASECLEKVLHIDNPNSTPFEAVEGDYVLVTDNEGNDQRGIVTFKIGSTFYVQLIDCGNVVSADKVYPLPEDLKDLVELGVKVTFKEILSPEMMIQLETCFFVINGEPVLGKWPCLVKGPEQRIIARGLLEKPTEPKKWQPKYVDLKSGSTVEISSLSPPNSFYVRLVDAETEQKFLDMNMEMIQFAKVKSYTVPPSVGELCCARFEEDSCFYRAIVNSVERGKVQVTFVDFGNEQATDLKDVKPLPDSLKNIPFFAVKVRLRNVSTRPWNNMIKDYLTKLTSENTELTMTYNEPITSGVILREKVSGVVVNDFIEKAKDKTNDIHSVNSFNSVKSNLLKRGEVYLDDDLKCTTVESGSKCTVALLYVDESEFETTHLFWATIAEFENFNYVNGELSALISDYCSAIDKPYQPSFRELCLAEFEGFWYRAACAGCEGDVFKVFFVDFGNVCEVKASSIRKMSKEFLKAPALAMNCTLKGSERLSGNPELTKKICEILLDRMNTFIEGVTITNAKEDLFLLEIPKIEEMLSG